MVDTTVDEIAALRRSESSVFAVSNSTGDISPMGSRSRVVFHQCTHDSVASSTSSMVRHGPRIVMSSALWSPMIDSATALS
jgi:hypothetical protein